MSHKTNIFKSACFLLKESVIYSVEAVETTHKENVLRGSYVVVIVQERKALIEEIKKNSCKWGRILIRQIYQHKQQSDNTSNLTDP